MINIYRDSFEHSGLYDALTGDGIVAAWATNAQGILAPVKTRYIHVYQAIPGKPPKDPEILQLSGLAPTDEGTILIYYQPERAAEIVTVRGKVTDRLPATKAQWGMIVRKFESPSA